MYPCTMMPVVPEIFDLENQSATPNIHPTPGQHVLLLILLVGSSSISRWHVSSCSDDWNSHEVLSLRVDVSAHFFDFDVRLGCSGIVSHPAKANTKSQTLRCWGLGSKELVARSEDQRNSSATQPSGDPELSESLKVCWGWEVTLDCAFCSDGRMD